MDDLYAEVQGGLAFSLFPVTSPTAKKHWHQGQWPQPRAALCGQCPANAVIIQSLKSGHRQSLVPAAGNQELSIKMANIFSEARH